MLLGARNNLLDRHFRQKRRISDLHMRQDTQIVRFGQQLQRFVVPDGERDRRVFKNVQPWRRKHRELIAVLFEPDHQIPRIASDVRLPRDQRVAAAHQPRLNNGRRSDAWNGVPNTCRNQSGRAFSTQLDPAAEQSALVEPGEQKVASQADQQLVIFLTVALQGIRGENQLVDVRQLLSHRDPAHVVDAEIDVPANRSGAHVHAEPPPLVLEADGETAVLEGVAARKPRFGTGGRRRRVLPQRHDGVDRRNRVQHQFIVTNKNIPPLADPTARFETVVARLAHHVQRPEHVELGDEHLGRPLRIDQQAIQTPRVAAARVERQLAEDEPEIVMCADLVQVRDPHHVRVFLILAIISVREKEGDRLNARLALKLADHVLVVRRDPGVELLGPFKPVFFCEPLGHRKKRPGPA